jgi:hypothetical protein
MAHFDQTARETAKADPKACYHWLQSCFARSSPLLFQKWQDTRRLPSPGEPDRINDLVAQFIDQSTGRFVETPTEFELEASADNLIRMSNYEIQLLKEINPHCDPTGAMVTSFLVNLTGKQRNRDWQFHFSSNNHGSQFKPFIVDLEDQDGPATLEKIRKAELALSVLPWLAMMKNTHSRQFITAWREVADLEPNLEAKQRYRDSVLVFAELSPTRVDWWNLLEDWIVRESMYINRWRTEGIDLGVLHSKREAVLKLVELKFEKPVSDNIGQTVEGTSSVKVLELWFERAATLSSLKEFREALEQTAETLKQTEEQTQPE